MRLLPSQEKAEPQKINRIHLRFTWANKKAVEMLSEKTVVQSDAWTEMFKAEQPLKITVQYSTGKTEKIHVDLEGMVPGTAGAFTDDGVVVALGGDTCTTIKLTLETAPESVYLSEAMFWYADEMSPSARQVAMSKSVATSTTSLLGQEDADLLQVGYLNKVFDAIKDAAEIVLMNLCLAGLSIVQGILSAIQAVFNGIASVLIYALERAIEAMGPHFFKINELMIGGSFDALKGGQVRLQFNIDMYLFKMHIGPWGFDLIFTLGNLIQKLFKKAVANLGKLRI